ncbi:serine/threonine-protein kinase, partial [Mycobacterium kiyosense]
MRKGTLMDEVAFGRYRLLSVIGQGGMGTVYRAHDTLMNRDVAIKVLPTALGDRADYRERFRREAHTAARLTEPHIIPIHESGEIDGQLYLVMPIVEGIDLGQLLRRDGPMSAQEAVHVIEQLASALDAAHAVGLVHRDIKPSNALVTGRNFVYLIDFGIAHDAAATKLTSTGMIVGTMAYMAPERFLAGTAGPSSDVYALTCVLHECLTGEHPFPGESMEQQIAGHLSLDPPRPSAQRAQVPAGFDEVISRGMAKKPEDRYASAVELADAARDALIAPAVPAHAAASAPTAVANPDVPTTPYRPRPYAQQRSARSPHATPLLPRSTPPTGRKRWLLIGA